MHKLDFPANRHDGKAAHNRKTLFATAPRRDSTNRSRCVSVGSVGVCGTVAGRGLAIQVMTVGHGSRKVLFIGSIHGDEPEGAVATAELPTAFEAAGLADTVTLTILEDANPDGRAAGTRGNANGIDVNRNFPASNFDSSDPSNGGKPLSEPEARAVVATIDRIAPNLVLVAHSWAGRQFINFDGPAREIAERFAAASGLRVESSSSFAPTPGSLGSYFGRDRGIPVLTIEVLKGSDKNAVWQQLRTALLQAIAG
jgi:protein MpaA